MYISTFCIAVCLDGHRRLIELFMAFRVDRKMLQLRFEYHYIRTEILSCFNQGISVTNKGQYHYTNIVVLKIQL